MRFLIPYSFSLLIALAILTPRDAAAVSLIRDTEIENYLRTVATPIWREAGLDPDNVRIFIVQEKSINAYVAGGQNIFIHTGLLEQMKDPDMLIGVLAHETGHIAGGHIARGAEKLKDAQLSMILGYVLGAAAAVGGQGDAGMAVIGGSQSMIQRNLLSFSRANEQSADQAALTYLDALGISAQGMLDTFELLRRQEMRAFGTPDPYLQTHPLSKDRIEHVRGHVETHTQKIPYPKAYDSPHQRMRAKLFAFLSLPPKTFARYPTTDRSIPARIARAIAWYKVPELEKSLAEVNNLISENSTDPFLYDLKGQILFENARSADAMAAYSKASELLPNAPLLLTALAETRIASKNPAQLPQAVKELEQATHLDESNSTSWRLLATAYGKQGNLGMTHTAMAEEAAIRGDAPTMTREAESALEKLPAGGPARLRMEDIKRMAEDLKKNEKNN